MGWTSSANTRDQVRMRFDSMEEAVAYAKRQGYAYSVEAAGHAAEGLFGQFPLRPRRPLDPLIVDTGARSSADRAAAF